MQLTMCWQFVAAFGPTCGVLIINDSMMTGGYGTHAGAEAKLSIGHEGRPFVILQGIAE